jgi:3-oxoacyl-[acyl-carrier protein] reductase
MNLHVAGKVALVTGGSQGIGLAIAHLLAAEGARVIISARNEIRLHQVVEAIRLKGGEAFGIAADVSDVAQIQMLFSKTELILGSPDILIVNAGGPPRGRAESLEDSAWAQAYELTLMSAVRLSRAALPAMIEKRWGRIVNITSVSVKQPVGNLVLSNSLRSAVTGFAKTLSAEVASYGVTVNNVAPGYTDTERLNELFKNQEEKMSLAQRIPVKRLASPEEIAAAAVFLSSQQAAYITGQTLVVDGGSTLATY